MARYRPKTEAAPGIRYLSAKDVAERYNRPLQWVYRCKKLPRKKVGKYLMYREDDLEMFENYRSNQGRGFFIRHDSQATKLQKARKALKFDCL